MTQPVQSKINTQLWNLAIETIDYQYRHAILPAEVRDYLITQQYNLFNSTEPTTVEEMMDDDSGEMEDNQ